MMRRRESLRWIGGALVCATGAVLASIACGPGNLHYLMEGSPATEPTADDPTDPCKHARPPKAPPKQDEQKVVNLTFATNDMRLDTGPTTASGLTAPQGLDLDGVCTCGVDAGPPSCKAPAGFQVTCDKVVRLDGGIGPDGKPLDGGTLEEGRDNVGGGLLSLALTQLPPVLGPDSIRKRINDGFYAILVRIASWNGLADDDQVAVSVYMSPGADMGKDENANLIKPKWDGNDRWTVEVGSVLDGKNKIGLECEGGLPLCDAAALDLKAYVSGGKVVATFDNIPFSFGDSEARLFIPFNSATLIAKIRGSETEPYTLDGEISGRWPAEAIINAVGNLAVVDNDEPDGGVVAFCTDPGRFEFFRQSVCGSVDLADLKKNDNKDKDCTTMSQSVRFTAGIAHLGKVQQSNAETNASLCPKDKDLSCAPIWKK